MQTRSSGSTSPRFSRQFKAPRKPVRHGFYRSRLATRGRITTSPSRRLFALNTISRVDCEPVLSAMLLAEADDALIVGDQRTSKLDRRRNQESVRRIAVFEMMQLIAAGGSLVTQRHCFDAGTIEETLDPCRNGNVEVDPSGVNEKRNLPNRDGAEQNGAAVLPAAVDQGTRRSAQSVVATVEAALLRLLWEKARRSRAPYCLAILAMPGCRTLPVILGMSPKPPKTPQSTGVSRSRIGGSCEEVANLYSATLVILQAGNWLAFVRPGIEQLSAARTDTFEFGGIVDGKPRPFV